jgi:predicted PurR-regulated permease PerM
MVPNIRNRVILVTVMLGLCLYVLVSAWAALVPFFLGVLFAYLLTPPIDFLDRHAPAFLRRHHISRPLAILLTYTLVLACIAGLLSYFIPAVANQSNVLVKNAPDYWERIQNLFTYDIQGMLDRIPPQISTAVQKTIDDSLTTLGQGIQKGVGVTLRTVSQTVSFVLGMVIVPFWMFYVLNDESHLKAAFFDLIPAKAREDVHCIATIVDGLLSSYLRGQLTLCLLVGLMCLVALLIIGVDLALLLATFAAIFELIPILGPYLGALPAVIIALINRPISALWVALAYAAVQQIENIFLVPRISGNAVRFHPAVVMVIVIIGSEIGGLWGMLLAVPLAAMVRDIYQYLYLRTTERGATPQMALELMRARNP